MDIYHPNSIYMRSMEPILSPDGRYYINQASLANLIVNNSPKLPSLPPEKVNKKLLLV